MTSTSRHRRVGYVILAVLASWLAAFPAARAENLLRNPGFEEIGKDGVPVNWQREFNPVLGGPFRVVEDAQEGQRAVCLMTEEWNYHRPQFITQSVALPANARSVHLTAWCKGQGQVDLVFRFLKADQPHKTTEYKESFGTVYYPAEVLNESSLSPTYGLYEAAADVPEGADGVMVKLGNTTGLLNRLNIWGKLLVDNASLSVSDAAVPPAKPTHEIKEKLDPLPAGTVDVAPQCRFVMRPPSLSPRLLIDGDVQTAPGFMPGLDRAGRVSFLFAKPVPVHSVSLHLLGNVESVAVRGDTDGDGTCETALGSAAGLTGKGLTGKGWLTLPLDAKPVQTVCVQPVRGQTCGFRSTFGLASEIKLILASKDAGVACPGGWGLQRPAPRPTWEAPHLSLRSVAMELPKMTKSRFRRMVCADLWMWGISGAYKKDGKAEGCANNPAFRNTLEMVKRMGVESILIDLTSSSCENLMPWPSKVANGTQENFLKPVIDALHAEGLEVFVELIHNITPFETIKWHYPQEETSRYPEMKQYPSIVHGTHFRDNWLTMTDEIMACGADGLGISFDEHYYKGHFMETFPKDDPARDLYRKRFGYDLPEHEDDSLKFRQWITMRHEGIADLFGYWTRELKKKYPKIYTNTMFMYPTAGYSYITENGTPLDLIGARSGVTEIGSDYQEPYGIYLGAAANGWRRGTMLHNGDMWPYPPLPDLHFYRTALHNLMYGSGSVNYWRHNYVVDYGHAAALTRAYAMVKDLDALGLWDARPPRSIALLSSRSSTDWWQIKSWWGKHEDPTWDRGLEGQRGWFADESTFYLLQKNGYPFDWLFLDNPDQLKDLDRYRVILIPFAYSISKGAAERLQAAADKGAKIILLDGRLGPTDEWGEPHPEPAIKALADSGKAIVIPEDILSWGGSAAFIEKVTRTIDTALGDGHPFKLYHDGKPVDATMLEKSPTERFVFLINNDKNPVTVSVQMPLPDGRYEVFARDDTGWYRVSIGNASVLTHQELRQFRVMIAREQPYVLYFRKAE